MRIKKQTGRFLAFLMTLALVFGSMQMPQMVYAEETDAAQTSTVQNEWAEAEEPAVVEEAEELQADEEQTAEESESAIEVTEPEIIEQSEEAGEPEGTADPAAETAEAELNADRTDADIELEEKETLAAEDGNERIDTPWGDWVGLPNWTYNIDNTGTVYLFNTEHPDGAELPYTITDVTIQKDESSADILEFEDPKHPDNWNLRAKNYGESTVTITYQIDGEQETRTQDVCINIADTVFEIDADSINRCREILPGEALTVNASMRRETCVPHIEEGEEQAVDDEGNLCWDYDTTDHDKLKEEGYRLAYQVRDNEDNFYEVTGDANFLEINAPEYAGDYPFGRGAGIIYEVKDAQGTVYGDCDFGFNVCDDYYEINLGDNDVDTALLMGASQDITPTLVHHYMKEADSSFIATVETVADAEFDWITYEGDITIEKNNDSYTLTRNCVDNIRIELISYVKENGERIPVRSLDWHFDGLDYEAHLDFSYHNGNRIFKDGGSLTVSLITSADIDREIEENGATITWHYTHFDESNEEDVAATDDLIVATEAPDKKSVTISYNSLTESEYNGIDVWATVEANDNEIARADNDRYIEVCDPDWSGYQEDDFWKALYGDERHIDKIFRQVWIQDGHCPEGKEDASIVVTKVEADSSYTNENGDESNKKIVEIEEETDGWKILAKEGGYVRININFEIQYDENDKSAPHTHGMDIYIGDEVQNIWLDMNTPCILPGETRTFELHAEVTKLLDQQHEDYNKYETGDHEDYSCVEYDHDGTWYKEVFIDSLKKLKELGYTFEAENTDSSITINSKDNIDNDNTYKISITADKDLTERDYHNVDFGIKMKYNSEDWHGIGCNIEIVDHYYILTNKINISEENCFIGVGDVWTVIPVLIKYDLENRNGIVTAPDGYEWENAGEDTHEIMVVPAEDGSYKVVRKTNDYAWGHLWAVFNNERVADYAVHFFIIESEDCVHGYTETRKAKAATCTEDGCTGDVHCLFCENVLNKGETIITKSTTIKAKGHTWDTGRVTKAATETTTGVKTYTCTVCKETKTETIPVLPKTEVSYSKPQKSTSKVTIPDVIDGCKVTSIDSNAFKNDKKLTQVKIGNNITTIGSGAFNGCKELTKVTLGKNVEVIGDNAFSGCKKLKTIKLGNNVTTIGKNAFAKCESLTSVTIPKNVTSIGSNAFKGCKNIKTITISSEKLTKKDLKTLKSLGKNTTIKLPKNKKVKEQYKKWLKGFKGKVK